MKFRPSQKPSRGFALISTLSIIVLLAFIAVGLLSLSSLSLRQNKISSGEKARDNAKIGLMAALNDLQVALGPDQRITAPATILSNTFAPATNTENWVGVWKTADPLYPTNGSRYDPSNPANRIFDRWLVSSPAPYTNSTDANTWADGRLAIPSPTSVTIFKGETLANDVAVDKVNFGTNGAYAYWVSDHSTKITCDWSEGNFADATEAQAARLSTAPGVDLSMLTRAPLLNPTDDGVPPINLAAPLFKTPIGAAPTSTSAFIDGLPKISSNEELTLTAGIMTGDYTTWKKSLFHNVATMSHGVLVDVKNGGLRRDLSLAFEMDGAAEAESATNFNAQIGEFVGNPSGAGDLLDAVQDIPGTTIRDRYLFRDTSTSMLPFSADITPTDTVVRGPSWHLMRDYANLYKSLSATGSLAARAYYPNRTYTNGSPEIEDLVDLHADNQWENDIYGSIKGSPINREFNIAGTQYYHRNIKANYAPVLLGINAIYSLKYEGDKLKMLVDPFFIIWNPYNVGISANKFAITVQNGLAGGMRFRVNDEKYYGRPSIHSNGAGSDTTFVDFAKHKTGTNADVTYLLSSLSMTPGEVLICSPPNNRGSTANELNDALEVGMNYDADDSGISFSQFPLYDVGSDGYSVTAGPTWTEITADSTDTIDVLFNIKSQSGNAIVNIIETSLPDSSKDPKDLTEEEDYGSQINGFECRLNLGSVTPPPNIDRGPVWNWRKDEWPLSYTFSELTEKKSFGLLSMLTIPTDYDEADTSFEVFSQINATPSLRTQLERFSTHPLNIVIKTVPADGINNLMNEVGIAINAFNNGNNGFYGKNYSLLEGDTHFSLLEIPKSPMKSLVQLASANIGNRLFEPTKALGSSWKPPYIPHDSIYLNSTSYTRGSTSTLNDVSWQINDAIFDRYFLTGISDRSGSILANLTQYYSNDHYTAEASPSIAPHVPVSTNTNNIISQLDPDPNTTVTPNTSGNPNSYKEIASYSMIQGAFNVNTTSVFAWEAFLRGNQNLSVNYFDGGTDTSLGTPFSLHATPSNPAPVSNINNWSQVSRLSNTQITTLATAIVTEVQNRGPFMSISDFINRRIHNPADDTTTNANLAHSYQGTLQEAIETSNINAGIRTNTSNATPNYDHTDTVSIFPHASGSYNGNRNCATGVPMEINQANLLLPLAPKLTARGDTFTIRAYGESGLSTAYCEAVVQRLPEYVDPTDNPWDESYINPLFPAGASQLSPINQTLGRRFKIISFRWLDPNTEV